MTKLESNIKEALEPIINEAGYRLYDVIYEKEGKDNYLRILIDNEKGINLEDCEKVNNIINDLLDEKDFIKDQYFLEVSSAGIERRLRCDEHLNENIGNKIEIHAFKPLVDKQKVVQGILEKNDKETITIKYNDESINVDKKDISNIKTIFNWEEE